MKVVRVVIAVVVTLAMLYIARTNSLGRPEHISQQENGFTFKITTVAKIIEYQSDTIAVHVTGPSGTDFRVVFRTSQLSGVPGDQPENFASIPMTPQPGVDDAYYTVVTAGPKGGRFYHYYFQTVDAAGKTLATFKHPNGSLFYLRYIGEVPPVILILHIAFIFATVFCVAMALIHGINLVTGRGDLRTVMLYLAWGTFFCFVGCYPFGIPMNYYAFNGSWEGVPFGTDATDNKTQLMFVFLLFAALTGLGTLTRGRFGRDVFSPRTIGGIAIGSFLVMLFIYLIPHSIQFSHALTYAFCYSWIGLLALIYVIALLRSARSKG